MYLAFRGLSVEGSLLGILTSPNSNAADSGVPLILLLGSWLVYLVPLGEGECFPRPAVGRTF